MKLEQQVVSLDVAKRLKELGVKQDALWSWYRLAPGHTSQLVLSLDFAGKDERISAFTVAELGEMLPTDDKSNSFKTGTGEWVMYYVNENENYHKEYADTEADARGAMLVYLLENHLITL